jgi:hypothetical protein
VTNCLWWVHIPDFFGRLPWPDFIADCRDNQCLAPLVSVTHCCQLLVCPLPCYMHVYRPLPSCNNTPTVPVARVFQFSLPHSMSQYTNITVQCGIFAFQTDAAFVPHVLMCNIPNV